MLIFLKILFTEFIAEMGDKTQLMLVAMTSKYKLRDIILGTAVAVMVLNGLAVLAGGLVSEYIPTWIIKIVAALAFLYFAATSLKKDDDDEEEFKEKKLQFAPVAVFCTFFVAELGDKTQLTAITFGANEGLHAALIVWLACSIGLFAADIVGMMIGYMLKSKTPDGLLNILAFFIFSIFGIVTLRQGLLLIPAISPSLAFGLTLMTAVIFGIICGLIIKMNIKKIAVAAITVILAACSIASAESSKDFHDLSSASGQGFPCSFTDSSEETEFQVYSVSVSRRPFEKERFEKRYKYKYDIQVIALAKSSDDGVHHARMRLTLWGSDNDERHDVYIGYTSSGRLVEETKTVYSNYSLEQFSVADVMCYYHVNTE